MSLWGGNVAYTCPNAYYEHGKPMVMCRKIDKDPYCGLQYYCPELKKYINTDRAKNCKILKDDGVRK